MKKRRNATLYPLVDYVKWAKRYSIPLKPNACLNCGQEIVPTIPLAMNGYRGLKTEDHGCPSSYNIKVIVSVDSRGNNTFGEWMRPKTYR